MPLERRCQTAASLKFSASAFALFHPFGRTKNLDLEMNYIALLAVVNFTLTFFGCGNYFPDFDRHKNLQQRTWKPQS
jgi:hypothetical protein